MPARKLYDDYYESGSTARKRQNSIEKNLNANRKTGKNKIARKNAVKKKKNLSMVAFILTGFMMAMVVTYRFNIISEKNLEAQNLKDELSNVEASLLISQIDVEQSTDLNEIEAYAKQKLGMQKPDKNQTIYIDTTNTTSTVEVDESTNFISSLIESIKDFINKIF